MVVPLLCIAGELVVEIISRTFYFTSNNIITEGNFDLRQDI